MNVKPRSTPYHCPLCVTERRCGYNGKLRFPNAAVPVCEHHGVDGVPSETQMIPVPIDLAGYRGPLEFTNVNGQVHYRVPGG